VASAGAALSSASGSIHVLRGVLVLGLSGFLALFWWVFGERRRFKGTPAVLSGRPRQGAGLA
jgi:hypothetical protein